MYSMTEAKKTLQENTSRAPALTIRLIADIDRIASLLLNEILHNPVLQALEATWRSLQHLTNQIQGNKKIKIRLLNITWQELVRDVSKVIEVSQSELFNKVYNQEFGMPGGEPYGVLIGDYSINITRQTDIDTLHLMSQISAAAFVPFISGVSAKSFGLNSFSELSRIQNIHHVFKSTDYSAWKNLQKTEDARFIGLVLPHTLVRAPYGRKKGLNTGFPFIEQNYKTSDYLWGNASFSFASILIRSYKESNWFITLRGISSQQKGGSVKHFPHLHFDTDRTGIAPKFVTAALISDTDERTLSELGFISLCQLPGRHEAVFYDNYSIQEHKQYTKEIATVNAKISASLQYMFCASRFAHYIKIIGRDKIGAFFSHMECERFLNAWLTKYIAANDDLTMEQKLNYPLRDAWVQVKQSPGKYQQYTCIIHLQPRMQLEQIKSNLVLVTQLSPIN